MKLFSVLRSNAAKSAYKRPSTRGRGILKRIEEWNFTAFHRLHAFSIEPDIAVSHSAPPFSLPPRFTSCNHHHHLVCPRNNTRIFAVDASQHLSVARVLTSRNRKNCPGYMGFSEQEQRWDVIPGYFWNRLLVSIEHILFDEQTLFPRLYFYITTPLCSLAHSGNKLDRWYHCFVVYR